MIGSVRRHVDMVRRHNPRQRDSRVVQAIARQRALQDHLLLQHLRFALHHILLRRFHIGFGLNDVDGCDGAQVGALLVVFVKLRVQVAASPA